MANQRGDTQAKILAYIEKATLQKGYPPSVREICDATGLKSTSTVHGHLIRLEKKGLLYRDSMKPRAISVPSDHQMYRTEMINVPIVGRVSAGTPILATENIEDYIALPQSMLGEGEHYVLGVRGESMIEAGIMDGDYVVVRKQPTAYNGDIVVAMVEDDATVKRFYRENGHFRLQPENPTMEPIIVPEVTILGKVVSLYRIF
ncbi:MAG: transcriptional repressor LexA [Candidatus Limiplasma sp.]|nr:transcriptional repressor LexA [Clostridiales bacterium]MDY3243399.1 transcriptional repressor LexA [Candidatus Limiplasma sp.]MDY4062617.1 transcriptional repressor LexA [Candidatus Limiplasma sp.]